MMQIEFYADIFKQREYVRHYGNTMTLKSICFFFFFCTMHFDCPEHLHVAWCPKLNYGCLLTFVL